MMRWPVLLVALPLVASAAVASAQTGTADGVVALARGDFQLAVQILKPIAEGRGETDPMAHFFMATLYETGRGVPFDLLKACALYERALIRDDNPFGVQAGRLFRELMKSHDREWLQDCQLLARLGFDHQFEPVTFTFGPGHSIAWELKGPIVSYGGTSKRMPWHVGSRGSIFLPIRQTELAAGSGTRHFSEIFAWRPYRDGRSWLLEWELFEVVRGDLIRVDVTSDPLLTVQADAPPGARNFDVRAYAHVRTNENGDAEWAVLKGPHAGRVGTIVQGRR